MCIECGRCKELQIKEIQAIAYEILNKALMEQDPDRSLNILMTELGELFKAERAYIFERNPDFTNSNTYEWVAEGVTPEIDNLQNVPEETSRNLYEAFERGEPIRIDDVEDVRDADPLLYETLKPQGIISLIVVPFYSEGKIIGFFGVDNPRALNLDNTLDMINLMCRFIVFTIEKKRLTRRLEEMSYRDQLTGFKNRFALNKYIREELDKTAKIGVVFCDVNDLKAINDECGHEEGDQHIVDACKILRGVFAEADHYRMGGDEFLTLCPGMLEVELYKQVAQFKERIEKENLQLAVGCAHKCPGCDFGETVEIAEKDMYEDKARYYNREGNDRREIKNS